MRLRVFLPSHIAADERVDQVSAEAESGAFSLLPRHVDFVTALASGLMSFVRDGRETFLAVDGGILVKRGDEVLVSAPNAVRGDDLDRLHRTVEEDFQRMDERERRARASLLRLEADFVRRFLELESRDT